LSQLGLRGSDLTNLGQSIARKADRLWNLMPATVCDDTDPAFRHVSLGSFDTGLSCE
jgi:hypothetical protein